MIDALQIALTKNHKFSSASLDALVSKKGTKILITMHRRENWGAPMHSAAMAIKRLSRVHPECDFLFPVHLNPAVRRVVYPILGRLKNVHLVEPVDYLDFVHLMAAAHLIITDSGGVQEEGPSLGKPVLVLREVTERPEAVEYGTAKLVGLDEAKIVRTVSRLLNDPHAYNAMASAVNPYGDGRAARRTVALIKNYFGLSRAAVREFSP